MREMLLKLSQLLRAGCGAVLVTVVESHGSAPRGPGARMLVTENGYLEGTIGGGTIEHEAVRLATEACKRTDAVSCFVRDYTLTNHQAGALGMVCGGEMRLLFQRLGPEAAGVMDEALQALGGDQPVFLVTELGTGRMWVAGEPPAAENAKPVFAQRIDPGGWAYVFGGGHVAQALVPLLQKAGFRCRVLDDRPEFVRRELFPGAEARLTDFANLCEVRLGPEDDALIMTRGHEHDLEALSAMLRTKARYIGMMGSRHKREVVFSALTRQGFGDTDMARVHSPIGLPIGAETPFEIAVSVAAELIACRAEWAKRKKAGE